jgi:hypothetical protein
MLDSVFGFKVALGLPATVTSPGRAVEWTGGPVGCVPGKVARERLPLVWAEFVGCCDVGVVRASLGLIADSGVILDCLSRRIPRSEA